MEVEAQGPAAGWKWDDAPAASDTAAPEKPKGHDFTILGVKIHVPAEGGARADSNVLGWGTEGAGVAPEDVLMAGQAVRGIAKATATGGALSGVKNAIMQADPIVKYQFVYHGLRAAGVPESFAIPAAMMASGYKRGAKAAPPPDAGPVSLPGYPRTGTTPAPAAVEPAPHLDTSVMARPGTLTSQQIGERIAAMNGKPKLAAQEPVYAPRPTPSEVPPMPTPAPVAVPTPAAPAVSPARIANDLGLAARRAGVQLTAADDAAVLSAIAKGADPSQAIAERIAVRAAEQAAAAARAQPSAEPPMTAEEMAARLTGKWGTPTDAEVATAVKNRNNTGQWSAPKRDMKAKAQAAREKTK